MGLITDPEAKLLGIVGGKKKRVVVFKLVQASGGWKAERRSGIRRIKFEHVPRRSPEDTPSSLNVLNLRSVSKLLLLLLTVIVIGKLVIC
jgi:hypothetical protein